MHGDRHCILLLDNLTAHEHIVDDPLLPKKLHFLFFPPNCTSFLQPADMGMIASLKIGYQMTMLTILSNICKSKESYEEAVAAGKRLHRGCKSIYNGSKANVLDALQILKKIWENDAKYATIDGVKRC